MFKNNDSGLWDLHKGLKCLPSITQRLKAENWSCNVVARCFYYTRRSKIPPGGRL